MTDRPTIDGQSPPAVPGPLSALEQLRETLHRQIGTALGPVARTLGRAGVTPNQISVAGAALTAISAGLIVQGRPLTGGAVFLVASGFDLFDGLLARTTGRATAFGALLDSTLDRVSEGVVLAAMAYVFAARGQPLDAAMVVLALLLSQLVSYARARAEGLGFACKVGVMTRAERVLLIAAGLMSGLEAEAIYLLAAASAVTVIQRVVHTGRQIDGRG